VTGTVRESARNRARCVGGFVLAYFITYITSRVARSGVRSALAGFLTVSSWGSAAPLDNGEPMTDLGSFNAMVRQWADKQPARYRLSALAFGYPCNRKTHSFDQTLAWVSKRSRKRPGEGVSLRKLKDDLGVFEASGVIEVERRRDGARNKSSVYHVRFDRVIQADDMGKRQRRRGRAVQANVVSAAKVTEDAERQAFLASLDVEPPEDESAAQDHIVSANKMVGDAKPKHEGYPDKCEACKRIPDAADAFYKHLANGGKDPWDDVPP
jgi:hypothetical protein